MIINVYIINVTMTLLYVIKLDVYIIYIIYSYSLKKYMFDITNEILLYTIHIIITNVTVNYIM